MAIPSDLTNIAQLGVTTGNVWGTRYTDLTLKHLLQADYLSFHEDFRADTIALQTAHNTRKQTTNALTNVNKDQECSHAHAKASLHKKFSPISGIISPMLLLALRRLI